MMYSPQHFVNRLSQMMVLVAIFIVLLFPVNNDLNSLRELPHSFEFESPFQARNKISSLSVSDPIVVSGNNDFDSKAITYGWSGDGSSSDPYIIENLSIINSTDSTYGISISSVSTKYFVIRNNYIEMTGVGSSGIYLYNVDNVGTIYNNTVVNNQDYGIYLYSSHGNNITSNIVKNNRNGIRIYLDGGNRVENNVIQNNTVVGLYLQSSDSNIIEYNSILNNTGSSFSNDGAVKYSSSNNNQFNHNNFSFNYWGVYSSVSSYNTFYNNSFFYNYDSLFHSSSNSYHQIVNNTFAYNTYAIHSSSSFTSNNISNNIFRYHSQTVIFFQSTTSHSIFSNNLFEHNTQGGVRFASGSTNNTFYDNLFFNNSYGLNSNVGSSWVYNNTFIENSYAVRNLNGNYGLYQNNTLMNNGYGFYVWNADNNTFLENNIVNNSQGIYFTSSNYNTFYGNNFLHNVEQGFSSTGTNYADNGTFGNFWLDHLGVDDNSDGILDTTYELEGSIAAIDYYPLSIWNNESFSPEIINAPNDLIYETHTIGHNLTWRAIDESPNNYEVFFNGSSQGTNTFTSREFVNVSVDGFDLGDTNVTVNFRDTDMNHASKTVFVKVIDTIQPNITLLSNVSFKEGSTDSFLNWSFIDFHPYNYSLYINEEFNKTGIWNNSNPVSVNVSHLLKGLYNYTMLVQDTSSNYNNSVLIVNIYDGTPPIISQPSNVTYEHGFTGHNITWVAWDNYPANYSIFREGILVDSGNWTSGGNILVSVDGLSSGTYKYVIIVQDESSWINSTTVYVNVTQSLSYYIDRPSDVSILEGFENLTLSWPIYSNDTGFYTIYQDLVNSSSGSWMNNQTINYTIISLPIGIYNITISLNNSKGEIKIDTVLVFVIDNTVPIISNFPPGLNVTIEYSQTLNLSWQAYDYSPSNYTIYVDHNVFVTEIWINNSIVDFSLSNLAVGEHNITIIFRDFNYLSQTHEITVYVVDTTNPILVGFPISANVTIEYGDILNLTWQAYDHSPSNYTIYLDNSEFVTDIWINNSLTTFTGIGLRLGNHNISIVFTDLFGQTVFHQLLVIVEDTKPPVLSPPDDISFIVNNLGPFEINWAISDDFNGTYYILRDGVNIQSGSWIGSEYITTEVTFLDVGSYNFTLVVVDFSGNVNSDMVSVDVSSDITTQPPSSSPVSTTATSMTIHSDQTSTTPQITSVQFWVLLIGIAVLVVRKRFQSKKLK